MRERVTNGTTTHEAECGRPAIPITTGGKLRLFRRTWAKIGGKGGPIGANDDSAETAGTA
jgi:hypothetical protein